MINLVTFVILLQFCILNSTAQFSNIRFLENSSIFPGKRDGILIVTLKNGIETTISNYKFTDVEANVACRTFGYPAVGVSVINNTTLFSGTMLLGDFKCSGSETHLKYCLNSGVREIHSHNGFQKMAAHVYCLETKKSTSLFNKNYATTCNKMSEYSLMKISNKVNTGFPQTKINGKMHFICNERFTFGMNEAACICNKMCINSVSPRPVMFMNNLELNIDSNSSFAEVSCKDCACSATPVQVCNSSYVVGIQCGDEPLTIEKSPTVNCNSQNMTVVWPKNTFPAIKTSLVELTSVCANATILSSPNDSVIVNIPLGDCNPKISDENLYVKYAYSLRRSYLSEGITRKSPATLTVECRVKKHSNVNAAVTFKKPLYTFIKNETKTKIGITLYTDGSFNVPVAQGHTFDITNLVYVKVFMEKPIKNVNLGLYNCVASSTEDFSGSKIVNLISYACPNKNFDVQLTYLSLTEIGIQFRPFNFIDQPQMPLYIKCETTKCYFPGDRNCKVCKNNSRKRRSIEIPKLLTITKGPIFFEKKKNHI